MKVKVIDEEHEKDRENSINTCIIENQIALIDINLSSSCSIYSEEQIYCFTALIMYTEIKEE